MQEQFQDRLLSCVDCHSEFIFTAGEQLFFFDKQFKNDPKRCKPCKSRRSGLAAAANGNGPAAAGLSRTETRTQCSDCGIETTVPFKPTQGRPVLCRQCFQLKNRAAVPASQDHAAETSVAMQAGPSRMATLSSLASPADLAYVAGLEVPSAVPPNAAQYATQLIAGGPAEMLAANPVQDLQNMPMEAPAA